MDSKKWTIYCHTHIETGRRYVGMTYRTMERRWSQHCVQARRAKGGRWHFPNAIRKYGPQAFSHEVLEVCYDLEVANLAEECWIEFYDTRNPKKGFNLAKGGGSRPHPLRKNPWNDPEYRDKSCLAAKRRWEDPDYRQRSTISHAKKSLRADFRKSLSESTSKLWSDPDYRERMSKASREVNARPEVKEKLAAANRGKVMSAESRAKISEVVRARYATK